MKLNRWVGLAHLAQALLIVLISGNFTLPITASFLRLDPATERLVPEPRTLIDVRIAWLVAGFFLLSAVAHLAVSTPPISAWYTRHLARRINYARWIEYSLSASLMIVVIAILVGIYDVAALIALFGVNAAMIAFGAMMEMHDQRRTDRTAWTPFWLGSIAGAVPWIAIGIYLFATPGVPSFVYWIYLSIFVFFNCFAVTMLLQYRRRGRWGDYLYGERVYILLSITAKSLLAWQVFAGTLQPN